MPDFSASAIARWSDPAQDTVMSFGEAGECFYRSHPRARFIRSLLLGASMLDAGAGDGSSIILGRWPDPPRTDLKMYAWAGEKGVQFDEFEGHEVSYWPERPPAFGGRRFDGILCAHFLEHIEDPLRFVAWAVDRLAPGGSIYLEWPSERSYDLPTNAELGAVGVPVTTGRFSDDGTHQRETPKFASVRQVLIDAGLFLRESGAVSAPFIDQQLPIHARRLQDIAAMTSAYWSHTAWASYLIACRE